VRSWLCTSKSPAKDDHKEKKEDARNFKPDDAAHAAEGPQKASNPACHIPGCLSGSLTGGPIPSPGFDGGLASWGVPECSRQPLRCGHALAAIRPATRNPVPKTRRSIEFHSVMMVAATLAEPVFLRLLPLAVAPGRRST